MLRGRISRDVRRANFPCNRGDVNDSSPTPLDDFGQRCMSATKRSSQIHVEVALPHALVTIDEKLRFDEAGILYNGVRPAPEAWAKASEGVFDTPGLPHFTPHSQSSDAKLFGNFLCRFLNLAGSARCHRYRGALAGESRRDGAPDAASTTGDKC